MNKLEVMALLFVVVFSTTVSASVGYTNPNLPNIPIDTSRTTVTNEFNNNTNSSYCWQNNCNTSSYVLKTGDTMSGDLEMRNSKIYIDNNINTQVGRLSASGDIFYISGLVPNTGGIQLTGDGVTSSLGFSGFDNALISGAYNGWTFDGTPIYAKSGITINDGSMLNIFDPSNTQSISIFDDGVDSQIQTTGGDLAITPFTRVMSLYDGTDLQIFSGGSSQLLTIKQDADKAIITSSTGKISLDNEHLNTTGNITASYFCNSTGSCINNWNFGSSSTFPNTNIAYINNTKTDVGNNTFSGATNTFSNKVGIGNSPTYTLDITAPNGSTAGIIVRQTGGYVNIPNPGTTADSAILNPRGFSFSSDGYTLPSAYQTTFGIGVAISRGAVAGLVVDNGVGTSGYNILTGQGANGFGMIPDGTARNMFNGTVSASSTITSTSTTEAFKGTWNNDYTLIHMPYQTGASYDLGIKSLANGRELRMYSKAADAGIVTIHTGATPTERVRVEYTGQVNIANLGGTYGSGSAYVCVYNNGTLFASDSACA